MLNMVAYGGYVRPAITWPAESDKELDLIYGAENGFTKAVVRAHLCNPVYIKQEENTGLSVNATISQS